uniref:C-type lectin domain-containing protein n=1 Tax=Oryzias latipes TaxID=8090 RepID=H2L5Y6_ORYLA
MEFYFYFYCLLGINKTLWDEIKQRKYLTEGEKKLKTNGLKKFYEKKNGLYQFVWIMFTFELNLKDFCKSVFEGKRCPEGWRRFGCSCYYESTGKKSWTDSRSFCQFAGSDLVVVNSKEEQVGVFTLVPSSFLCLGFSTCMCAAVMFSKDPYDYYYAVFLSADGKWTEKDKTYTKNWICEK